MIARGGWGSLNFDWWGTICSMNGFSAILFLTMCAGLFLGNGMCKDVIENRVSDIEKLKRDFETEIANGERDPSEKFVQPDATDVEWICGIQRQFIG